MSHVPRSSPDHDSERDTAIIARVVALIHARRKGDYLAATEAHQELERLGVLVRFLRQPKAVARE